MKRHLPTIVLPLLILALGTGLGGYFLGKHQGYEDGRTSGYAQGRKDELSFLKDEYTVTINGQISLAYQQGCRSEANGIAAALGVDASTVQREISTDCGGQAPVPWFSFDH